MAESANEQLEDWANTSAINILRVSGGMRNAVVSQLETLERDLVRQVASLPDTSRRRSLNALLRQTRESIQETYRTIAANQHVALEKMAGLQYKSTVQALNGAIGVPILRRLPTESQINAIMRDSLIQGHHSAAWWKTQSETLQFKFNGEMRDGFLRGESVPDLVRRVRGTKANNYNDGIMNIPKNQAETLVRTSVQTVSNTARLETIEENQDLMKGIRWVATLDGRTTKICISLDGLMWSLPDYKPIGHNKEFPGVTAHWGCRSTQSPVLKSLAELSGKKIKPLDDKTFQQAVDDNLKAKGVDPERRNKMKARVRASMDGAVPATRTYGEWLETKDETFQDQVLGKRRADLFRSGTLGVRQLTNHDNRPLTLEQLDSAIEADGAELAVETEGTAATITAAAESAATARDIVNAISQINDEAKSEIARILSKPGTRNKLLAESIRELQKSDPDLTPSQLLAEARGMARQKRLDRGAS